MARDTPRTGDGRTSTPGAVKGVVYRNPKTGKAVAAPAAGTAGRGRTIADVLGITGKHRKRQGG